MAISKETMERIGKDAIAHGGNPHQYAAGAVAEAEKALCLIEALEELLDNIPKQTNDYDWWEDGLTKAVEQATAALQSYTNSLK